MIGDGLKGKAAKRAMKKAIDEANKQLTIINKAETSATKDKEEKKSAVLSLKAKSFVPTKPIVPPAQNQIGLGNK